MAEVEGPLMAEVEGPLTAEVEGSLTAEVEGPLMAEVEGPLMAEVEGPLMAEVEDPFTAHTVIRRSFTAEDRVSSQFNPFETCSGQSGTGQGFLPALRFARSVYFHRNSAFICVNMSLLTEGQKYEAWDVSGSRASLYRQVLSIF